MGYVCIIIGLILQIITIVIIRYGAKKKSRLSCHVIGTITKYKKDKYNNNWYRSEQRDINQTHAVVKFYTEDGQKIKTKAINPIIIKKYKINSSVDVWYDPEDPRYFQIRY